MKDINQLISGGLRVPKALRRMKHWVMHAVCGADATTSFSPDLPVLTPLPNVVVCDQLQGAAWSLRPFGSENAKVVPGYFAFDEPHPPLPTDQVHRVRAAKLSRLIAQIASRFGLLDDSEDRWTALHTKIAGLNASAPKGTRYRVIFAGRHGEGFRAYRSHYWFAVAHYSRQCRRSEIRHGCAHSPYIFAWTDVPQAWNRCALYLA